MWCKSICIRVEDGSLKFFFLVWNLENEMDKENEEDGWKNHSSGINTTHKVVFLNKPISWITQVTKEIHSHALEGD